jgi:hypothetical protein
MKVSILVHTINFCGDHSADACIALDYKEGETVDQLIERAQLGRNQYAGKGEFVALRLAHDTP